MATTIIIIAIAIIIIAIIIIVRVNCMAQTTTHECPTPLKYIRGKQQSPRLALNAVSGMK